MKCNIEEKFSDNIYNIMKQTKNARKNKNNRTKKVVGGLDTNIALIIALNLMALGYRLWTDPSTQQMYMNSIYPMANKLERQIGDRKVSLKQVLNEQNMRPDRPDYRQFPKSIKPFFESLNNNVKSRSSMANSAANIPKNVSLKEDHQQAVRHESAKGSRGTRKTSANRASTRG